MLKVKNLKAGAKEIEILKGIDLVVKPGEVHVVMGPNGSGKSTLAQVIAGSPFYTTDPTSSSKTRLRGVSSGQMMFNGIDIGKLTPDKRAKLGIFLGFQNPVEIPGVSVFNVLRKAGKVTSQSPSNLTAFRQQLLEYASSLKLGDGHLRRSFNEGFSGGEKKRNEILQMLALKPKLVILDEIDSGLDVDGLKLVAAAIKKFRHDDPVSSMILITHYARILKYLKADFVHVMADGKIVKSGKQKLAEDIEESGYTQLSS